MGCWWMSDMPVIDRRFRGLAPAALLFGGLLLLVVRRRALRPGADYQVKQMSLSRRLISDSGRVGQRKNRILALFEVDVTEARAVIRRHRDRTGESLSFTAFILTCLGRAIDANRYFHARRDIWGRLILFDEVDCATMVETELEGEKYPVPHVIRAINRRGVRSIHDEIRGVQADPRHSGSLQFPKWLVTAFLLLPAPLRDIFYRLTARQPRAFKQRAGTVMVTAVGMFGEGSGWGIGSPSPYTMSLLLGGIAERPAPAGGVPAAREYLSLTVELDHDLIDGAPAARFLSRLKALIEEGYGLEEFG